MKSSGCGDQEEWRMCDTTTLIIRLVHISKTRALQYSATTPMDWTDCVNHFLSIFRPPVLDLPRVSCNYCSAVCYMFLLWSTN